MKKFLSVLLCALLMCSLFSGLAASASTNDIADATVSGKNGESFTNKAIYLDTTITGRCTITSSRYYGLFVKEENRYVQGYATSKATTKTVGSYTYYENYARVAYGETKAKISTQHDQLAIPCSVYGDPATITYQQKGTAEGVIYCYTRVSYKNSYGNQTHSGVGRYYTYS